MDTNKDELLLEMERPSMLPKNFLHPENIEDLTM